MRKHSDVARPVADMETGRGEAAADVSSAQLGEPGCMEAWPMMHSLIDRVSEGQGRQNGV